MSEIVPRERLTKQAMQGVISVAGGIGAFVLASLTAIHWIGIVVGGLIAVAGLAMSGSKHDRALGVVTTIVGAATLAASLPFLTRLFGGLVHGLFVGAGIVLVGLGVYSLVKFFRGMRTRT